MTTITLLSGSLETIATGGWWGRVHHRLTSISTGGWFVMYGIDQGRLAGRAGGDTLFVLNGKLRRKAGHYPRNPRTPIQYETRRLSTYLNKQWPNLTGEQQDLWDTYGQYPEIAMGGFFAFHDNNTRLLFSDHPDFSFQTTPPDPPDLPNTPTGLTAKYLVGSDEWEFAWITPNDASLYVQLWAWQQATYNIKTGTFYTHKETTRSDNLSIKIDASSYQPGTIIEGYTRTLNLEGERSNWTTTKEATNMIPEWPQNFITVGKTNADYASIQNAQNSISDATVTNQYLIGLFPGEYEENIEIKEFTHVWGVDKQTCVIHSADSNDLVMMEANSSLRNITLNKKGSSSVPCLNPGNHTGIIVENCFIHPDNVNAHGIYMVGGEITVKKCNIITTSKNAIEVNDEDGIIVHIKIEGCYLYSSGNDPLYFEIGFTPNNTAKIYNNTLYGNGANAITAQLNPPGTLKFTSAHNRMNGGIQDTITDLIGTPYNVIDADIESF